MAATAAALELQEKQNRTRLETLVHANEELLREQVRRAFEAKYGSRDWRNGAGVATAMPTLAASLAAIQRKRLVQDDASDWDVTLLNAVLAALLESRSSAKAKSLREAASQVVAVRNLCAHAASGRVKQTAYARYWKMAMGAYERLGGDPATAAWMVTLAEQQQSATGESSYYGATQSSQRTLSVKPHWEGRKRTRGKKKKKGSSSTQNAEPHKATPPKPQQAKQSTDQQQRRERSEDAPTYYYDDDYDVYYDQHGVQFYYDEDADVYYDQQNDYHPFNGARYQPQYRTFISRRERRREYEEYLAEQLAEHALSLPEPSQALSSLWSLAALVAGGVGIAALYHAMRR